MQQAGLLDTRAFGALSAVYDAAKIGYCVTYPSLPAPTLVDRPLSLADAGGLLSVLSWLQRVLPRGKGAVPRALGKALARPLSRYLTTRHGTKLVLSPSSYDVYATMRGCDNAWDYHDFEVIRAGTPEGGVLYEVGANVGYFAVEHAKLDPGGRVYAFEPQSDLARAIAASASANGFGNLFVYNVLVGDRSGEATLYLAPGTIHASAVPDSGRPISSTVSMPMIALDDLVESGAALPPDLVKMDVEGSEALVFQGAARLFRSAKPHIYLEYLPEFDVGGRIRSEIESLVRDVPSYRLLGSPNNSLRHKYRERLFAIRSDADWADIDEVFLLNTDRPVRSQAMFENGVGAID